MLEWVFWRLVGADFGERGIVSFNDICLFDENHGRKVFKFY
jgi:hypothetical protein